MQTVMEPRRLTVDWGPMEQTSLRITVIIISVVLTPLGFGSFMVMTAERSIIAQIRADRWFPGFGKECSSNG